MDYDAWLEKPYQDQAERAEADEQARAAGFADADEWWAAMKEQAELDRWERENDR